VSKNLVDYGSGNGLGRDIARGALTEVTAWSLGTPDEELAPQWRDTARGFKPVKLEYAMRPPPKPRCSWRWTASGA